MSYATFLNGGIAVSNITIDDGDTLIAALAAALEANKGSEILQFDTQWKKCGKIDVDFADFILLWGTEGDDGPKEGDALFIRGSEYIGGTRKHVLRQLNWLMEYIRSKCPKAEFSGRVVEVDVESPGECCDIWYEPSEDGRPYCRAFETEVVKADEITERMLQPFPECDFSNGDDGEADE